MFGILIIMIMIAFGGFIALLGDRVGMRVGKKRLSLFGLRPKYTSMIITVLTGFLIAGGTLLILTAMSEYVRTAIFELNAIRNKVVSLTRELGLKENQYNQLHLKLQDVAAQRNLAEDRLRKTQAQYSQAELNLQSRKAELAAVQDRLKSLTRMNHDLTNQNSSLTLQEARLNQQIQNLEGWMKSLEERNKVMLDQPLLFYVGEIMTARVVEPGIPKDKILSSVVEPMLNEANDLALKRGARIPGKKDVALRSLPQRISEICDQLATLTTKSVLRVVVDKNSTGGEPATVNLELYPDRLIFRDGEIIEESQVSATASESELRDQLIGLLLLANNKAIEKGIITDGSNLRDLVSVSEVAQIINRIKDHKTGNFKVCLVAAADLYRVDAFKVKYLLVSKE